VHAEVALYLATDPLAGEWLRGINPAARSLARHYERGKPRLETYEAMADEIVGEVERGLEVCAAFYGHPAVFVHPSHAAVARVRAQGLPAVMLPAVSAEDCLFADLCFDPGAAGCQSYEATDFLVHRRRIDVTAALVLWQVTAIGVATYEPPPAAAGLRVLAETLLDSYPAGHEVTLYEASPFPIGSPVIERLPLGALAEAIPTPLATLYVPPLREPTPDAAMVERLGLTR